MKRFLCLLFILCLLPVSVFAEPSSWAEESINKAYEMNVVPEGFDDNWQQAVTRQEFSELAIRFMAHNLDYELEEFFDYVKSVDSKVGTAVSANGDFTFKSVPKENVVLFTDCDDKFVLLAAEMGIVQGVGNGAYEPERSITREEAALMLARARFLCTNTMGYSTEYFADYSEVSDWAKRAVRHMKSSGVMQGVGDNKFDPKGTYSREMSVVTFVRQSNLKISGGDYKMRPTLERIIASYDEHPIFEVTETIETQYGTLLVIVSGGAMHTGGQSLVFVTNDCEEISFSKEVPYDTPWAQSHYETMEVSEDGSKLIYTYSFDEQAVHTNGDGEVSAVLHEKGSYVFTADLTSGEVTYVFTPAE